MTDPALIVALRACASGSIDADVGPRPSDLTVRLGRTGDLPGRGCRAHRTALDGPGHGRRNR